ncbi:MAG TPA: DUF5996 family protein [Gemmatimonadaceae bacterium]|nr:DUF5996 family protein [Gemmatimonadaceae bacterium]
MSYTLESAASTWVPVPPMPAAALTDARLQLHQAAQVANAPAISYLAPAPDDSHTNFGWSPDLLAFVSGRVVFAQPRRFAWRPADFTMLALDDAGPAIASFGLQGHTLEEAHAWVRAQCEEAGADSMRYTPRKHYEIPRHPVAQGAKFTGNPGAGRAHSQLWDNASRFLDAVAASNAGASSVRLWPHHFDVGLIIPIDARRSIGAGYTPGDHHYDEPYWYVNPYPRPTGAAHPALDGGAHWHERDFFGAVLPWSACAASSAQGDAVASYLRSALAGARLLLGA